MGRLFTPTKRFYEDTTTPEIQIKRACHKIKHFPISQQIFNESGTFANQRVVEELFKLVNVFNQDNLSLIKQDPRLEELVRSAVKGIFEKFAGVELENHKIKNDISDDPSKLSEEDHAHLEWAKRFIFGYQNVAVTPEHMTDEHFAELLKNKQAKVTEKFKCLFPIAGGEGVLGKASLGDFMRKLKTILKTILPHAQSLENRVRDNNRFTAEQALLAHQIIQNHNAATNYAPVFNQAIADPPVYGPDVPLNLAGLPARLTVVEALDASFIADDHSDDDRSDDEQVYYNGVPEGFDLDTDNDEESDLERSPKRRRM